MHESLLELIKIKESRTGNKQNVDTWMNTRRNFESKLGRPIYSFTIYQKIKRVTITLENEEYPILSLWHRLT